MDARWQWWNRSHPQTLQIAVFLCYFNGLMLFINSPGSGSFMIPILILALATIASAVGMANDKRLAYYAAVVIAFIALVTSLEPLLRVVSLGYSLGTVLLQLGVPLAIRLIFDIALVVALLHRQTRDYQRVWFG